MRDRAMIVVLALCAFALSPQPSLAISCGPACDFTRCSPPPRCPHGLVKGSCDCCQVCGKGPGDFCTRTDILCGPGLECILRGLLDSGVCRNSTVAALAAAEQSSDSSEEYYTRSGARTNQHFAAFTVLALMLVYLLQ